MALLSVCNEFFGLGTFFCFLFLLFRGRAGGDLGWGWSRSLTYLNIMLMTQLMLVCYFTFYPA